MDRLQYRVLLPLVNEKEQMDRLHTYVGHRIRTMQEQLENLQELDQIRALQGSIKELRRFYTLRDEVLKGSE